MEQIAESGGLFNLEDAAKVLGRISSWTLRKHLRQGTVAAVRIGRRLFISQTEIQRIQTKGLPSLRPEIKKQVVPN
jgi:phage antirepressor YoqD-like protein